MFATHADEPWHRCYRELAPKLLLFARQWMPSQADAEDVVQAAFVRFWKKHPAAEREHYPLLYAAVRTIALDTLRGNDRRIRRENAPEAPNKARKFRSLTSASSRARFLRSLRRT